MEKDPFKEKLPHFSQKTVQHVVTHYQKLNTHPYFGRSDVEAVLGLKSAMASKLLKMLLDTQVIVSVKGQGKGKYQFSKPNKHHEFTGI